MIDAKRAFIAVAYAELARCTIIHLGRAIEVDQHCWYFGAVVSQGDDGTIVTKCVPFGCVLMRRGALEMIAASRILRPPKVSGGRLGFFSPFAGGEPGQSRQEDALFSVRLQAAGGELRVLVDAPVVHHKPGGAYSSNLADYLPAVLAGRMLRRINFERAPNAGQVRALVERGIFAPGAMLPAHPMSLNQDRMLAASFPRPMTMRSTPPMST